MHPMRILLRSLAVAMAAAFAVLPATPLALRLCRMQEGPLPGRLMAGHCRSAADCCADRCCGAPERSEAGPSAVARSAPASSGCCLNLTLRGAEQPLAPKKAPGADGPDSDAPIASPPAAAALALPADPAPHAGPADRAAPPRPLSSQRIPLRI